MNQETDQAVESNIRDTSQQGRSSNDGSTLLLALGGIVGLFNMLTRVVQFGKGFEMVALAQNLADHGTYADPFGYLATGPTAANPPLYPFILAIIVRIFRSYGLVAFVATFLNIIAIAVAATLLPRLSLVFYRDKRPGFVAAILLIFSAPLSPSWDVELTVLTLLIFCLFTWSTIASRRSRLSAIAAGLLASALFLFNPSTLLIFGPWLIWLLYLHRGTLRQAIAYCCIAVAVLAMTGGAWGLRNRQQLGRFVIRTNFGMTVYVSNNDCARPSMKASELSFCYQENHPNTSMKEAQLLKSLGEVEYDRVRTADTERWIRTHPAAFVRLTLARIRDFWFPVPWDSLLQVVVIWIASVLSVPGLIIMARRHDQALIFVLAVLLIYPPMYYIVVSAVRYRLPVLWISLLPAGAFIIWLWDRFRAAKTMSTRG